MSKKNSKGKSRNNVATNGSVTALYRKAVRATRVGPLFNAFPYPTKISPETIALFIASHTKPNDVVLDCFAGSGTTGLGAILCAQPTDGMIREAKRARLPIQWGPRRAILYEIGVLGSFVARVLCSPPDPTIFSATAEKILREVEAQYAWLYEARSPEGNKGSVRHIIWSDILQCPFCRKHSLLWDACVSRDPAKISETFLCPKCGHESDFDNIRRIMENQDDDLLSANRKVRRRRPAWVYGITDGRAWMRPVQPSDMRILKRIESEPIPQCVPNVPIPWGDLYRRGYHEGITHLHHFYTRRNLIAFGALWDKVEEQPVELRDALRFWLLSYNASHATIMSRVVAKKGQKDLVVTSAQPGVLYVSGLPVEKNVFAGLRRKLNTITQAFKVTYGNDGLVQVQNSSSLSTNLPDGSVDYVFTDPPFGGNIPYAEVNFLNEAWLGQMTDTMNEVIISPHQGKTIDKYQLLLHRAFEESYRVLRSNGKATVVFHSTSSKVWNALQAACKKAGFSVKHASVLDKTQGSFKQVTTKGAVKGDPIILLAKNKKRTNGKTAEVWTVVDKLMRKAIISKDPAEVTPQRIYSRLVAHYLTCHHEVPIDAGDFYRQFAKKQVSP